MKPSLRELFLAPDALDAQNNPLVRLGALRHLHRTMERELVRPRLESILRGQDVASLLTQEPSASVFPLHVAVAVAQEGGIDGIHWLLAYIGAADLRHQRLGFTALRNCSEFPLAVLLGASVAADKIATAYEALGDLVALSDDQAWTLARSSDREEARLTTTILESAVGRLSGVVRPDKRLAFGTVITRPVQKPIAGFRYTGFLVVEDVDGRLKAVPYEMADLVNRSDGGARMSVSEMLREAGRRVLVTYDHGDNSEAQAIYTVPFAPFANLDDIMARMAASCEGLSVAVVAHRWETPRDQMYRLVASDGRTDKGYDGENRMPLGTCALWHVSSPRPFRTRHRLSTGSLADVVARWALRTDLERAAILQTWDHGYKLGSETGRIVDGPKDQLPEEPIVFLETNATTGRTFVVRMPLARWKPDERSRVLSGFFENSRANLGVVVHIATSAGTSSDATALIVNADSGRRETRRVSVGIVPGTPVFWREVEGKVYTSYLEDQVVDQACRRCFGTRHRLCETCAGEGRAACSNCEGTGNHSCARCNGSRQVRIACPSCGGTGNCSNCHGRATVTLTCTICSGTGRYADTGRPCKKCGGLGTFAGVCRSCGTSHPPGKCSRCAGVGYGEKLCKVCNGSGRHSCGRCRATGIGPCGRCLGALVSACECGATAPIRLRPTTIGR